MEVSSHALDAAPRRRARASPSPCSPTSGATTSTSTARRSATSRPRPACSSRRWRALGVVNVDDPYGRLLLDAAPIPMTSYSLADAERRSTSAPTASDVHAGAASRSRLPLGGRFNVPNALAAATAAAAARRRPTATSPPAWPPRRPVPGRFEPVDAGQPFAVIVDYAHTPDEPGAVARRGPRGGRRAAGCIVVFGCGGDRDPAKRPAMGEVAAELADRGRRHLGQPSQRGSGCHHRGRDRRHPRTARRRASCTEPDRRAAIALALAEAGPGDVVVIAGKGHETTQTIGDATVPVRRPRRRPASCSEAARR